MILVYQPTAFEVTHDFGTGYADTCLYAPGVYAFNNETHALSICGNGFTVVWTQDEGWLDVADAGIFTALRMPDADETHGFAYPSIGTGLNDDTSYMFGRLLNIKYARKDDGLKIEYEPTTETTERISLAKKVTDEIYKERTKILSSTSMGDSLRNMYLRNYSQDTFSFKQPFIFDLSKNKQEMLAIVKNVLSTYGANAKSAEDCMLSGEIDLDRVEQIAYTDPILYNFGGSLFNGVRDVLTLASPYAVSCCTAFAMRDYGILANTPSAELLNFVNASDNAEYIDYFIYAITDGQYIEDLLIWAVDNRTLYNAFKAFGGETDEELSFDDYLASFRPQLLNCEMQDNAYCVWNSVDGWNVDALISIVKDNGIVTPDDIDKYSIKTLQVLLQAAGSFYDTIEDVTWLGEASGEPRPVAEWSEVAQQEEEAPSEQADEPTPEDFLFSERTALTNLKLLQNELKPFMYSGVFFNKGMTKEEVSDHLAKILADLDNTDATVYKNFEDAPVEAPVE